MLNIRFQNPMQGPLITISFGDSDGVALAFVPAALSSAPADIVATSAAVGGAAATATGASVVTAVVAASGFFSGDSPSRSPQPEVSAQPLRGLSRFSSAMASAQTADAAPVPDAVALPSDPTDPVAAATPIDWAALLAADPVEFFRLAQAQANTWKREILRRLDNGESPTSILQWLNTIVTPESDLIFKAFKPTQRDKSSLRAVQHDLGHQLIDLKLGITYRLQEGDPESLRAVRAICATDLKLVDQMISRLMATFAGRVLVVRGHGLPEFELKLADGVDPEEVIALLENLIRNAGDHPNPGQIPAVIIEFDGNHLIVRDTAAGMDEATAQKLRDAVRIHDGKEVTKETENPDTKGHGYGWQSIRETCDRLGIKWELESQPGQGTTVTLTVPDGFFAPL